jgi:hypothetical protein
MKKEIMELLEKENGVLKLNEYFYLKRWTKDALGNNYDGLRLESKFVSKHNCFVEIKSRDFVEIQKEIEEEMQKALDEFSKSLLSNFKCGYLN